MRGLIYLIFKILYRGFRKVTKITNIREAIKKKQSKYRHCPEGGGWFNPCPNVFGALF